MHAHLLTANCLAWVECSPQAPIKGVTPVQVKVKGARKIGFQEFQSSLQLVADKKVRILGHA